MKKMMVLVAVMFISMTSAFASTGYDFLLELNNKSTFNALTKYVDADMEQKDQLKRMFADSNAKLKRAIKSNDEAAIKKALYFNLANAKVILSEEQYKKYLSVINTSYQHSQTNEEVASL